EILEISQGKALVLFTAKTDMEEVYAQLQSGDLPYKILMQQPGASQDRILQEFKDDTNSVLLGTGAYWEGISIEGKSLSNLIIFRLPFPVPDPIINYKASVAKDPLMDVQVPEMIIKFKQGIGRLIRNFTDTGIVSIIDSRLRDNPKSRYYDVAWASLPIHNRTTSLTELEEFYHKITVGQG
ncbi:MAG: helicase C-terminal domain-containing protein, partial [Lachnospiraceae bacterium]